MKRSFFAVTLIAAVLGCSEAPRAHHLGSAPSTDPRGSPGWVVDQFFGWTTFPDESLYVTPAFQRQFAINATIGAQLAMNATVTFRKLMQDNVNAAYATTLPGANGPRDIYTYLFRDTATGAWQIGALRTSQLARELSGVIDSLKRREKIVNNASPTLVEALQLSSSSDSVIKQYLLTHTGAVAAIAEAFQAQSDVQTFGTDDSLAIAERRGARVNDPHAAIRRLLDQAPISGVFRIAQYPGCAFVLIGGIKTQQVGYIYAPEGCKPPSLSPGRFILVEPIEPHWFEFKTL